MTGEPSIEFVINGGHNRVAFWTVAGGGMDSCRHKNGAEMTTKNRPCIPIIPKKSRKAELATARTEALEECLSIAASGLSHKEVVDAIRRLKDALHDPLGRYGSSMRAVLNMLSLE